MKQSDWMKLTPRQQHVMLLAMYVRNAIEDFHVKHLSDAQMKELNPIIRQALYNIVTAIEDGLDRSQGQLLISYLITQIPDYWEVPSEAPDLGDEVNEAA